MTIRIAVAAVGFGTLIHAPGLASEGFEVAAIWDEDRGKAESEAARLGVPAVFTDYDEMLAMPGLDAVTVCTPPWLHHDMAIAALRAGKHVISEKPFAPTLDEAREMADVAEASGLTAMVAHEFRYTSGRAYVKELIEAGYLGVPKFALVRLLRGPDSAPPAVPVEWDPYNDNAKVGGGFLYRMGSHYVDALRHWFGEVTEVDGRLLTTNPDRLRDGSPYAADADDTFFFTLAFESGVVAQMVGGRAAPFAADFSVSLSGSEGVLLTPQTTINPPSHGVVLGARLGEDEAPRPLEIPERLQSFQDERDDRLFPFRMFARAFRAGIEGGYSPGPSFTDGFRCIEVLDAVRRSSATGRRIVLDH